MCSPSQPRSPPIRVRVEVRVSASASISVRVRVRVRVRVEVEVEIEVGVTVSVRSTFASPTRALSSSPVVYLGSTTTTSPR